MDDVKDYLKKLIKQDDVVVIGCSGGPDSICLFDILKNLQKEIDFSLICAHVNHNVRKESKNEQIFMEKYCLKNKIPFETMTITKYSDDNFENEARTIRYKYFDDLMKKYNGTYLMTAHHGDDLIETILMKIVRGSSISGYSGFSKEVDKSSYKIIRPLISVTKEDILNYNKKHKLNYFIDKTNFDNFHTRNRYRKVVLPFLKKEDKNVHEKFLKYSKTLQMYNEYINKETTKIIKKAYQSDYQRVYHNHAMCSYHCEHCKYQNVPKIGDITIGDFWWIDNNDKEVDYKRGISALLTNNEKGREFFANINNNQFAVKKQVPFEWLKGNGFTVKGTHNFVTKTQFVL